MSKLNLNINLVDEARNHAKEIAKDTQTYIDQHTTVTVERTVCRLLGIDGVDEFSVPLPNVVVEEVKNKGNLGKGISYYLGNAMIETGLSPQEIAIKVANKEVDLATLPKHDVFEIRAKLQPIVKDYLAKIKSNREKREAIQAEHGVKSGPELYVIVATGNIYEDVTQAVAAAKQGADIIAVIRSTGQSLLDYVPYGPTTEGFGGTFATQENFRIMRKALDDIGDELGRYIKLVNYASGLCMPEISAMGALERLDVMLNDSLYGILFRDINMKRTFIDQYFSRVINSYAGIIINTGEDNYLTTADAIEEAHTVLASQFINEQFALLAHLPAELQGLGHAFEINPDQENGFLLEIAQAQMAREIFPNAPLKYMPPTKFMTGNIFKGHVQDALFNMATIMTNQKIHLLGMMTEAIHTPFMSDRALAIENANYIFNTMKNISDEIEFKSDGIIKKRADEVLMNAEDLLNRIKQIGIFETIEKGMFAGIKRPQDGGKGLKDVYVKEDMYFNLVQELMIEELKGGE
ncbi:lysine 5,6-aminomutase subunit alpha [Haloplasma contractile]|uniref:Beta-lysine 56-aminomutase protein n=1 Tax=Haloplasma contractile SSD-17B TaxID=1033810 RepID=F7PW13_9MOLU|nr:lysine 5,6-aminomutase subunit alpha [Haloplasma contractile]ERJ12664.1 beta-lysine 56-aminomutase protein [Haloplasma contractile SSD-17B]